ncbi:LacI family DNA-binding transcriptional regulator [Dictyobacter formicarum]|uniref:LacI family transcriptional regulator n=1 Tax=Dictyobacter formicarum TaxID=2778368 RepID=A0ABQ3VDP9_9CHLR|nr:LacI family DNA-binding transcriptional regulator [Dictyobacter formicarum]GHO83621.1 LacI family transcriptional regulator [Dictyobacter formicarum]
MAEGLEEIAARAGVSIATASRALNGKGGVKGETRQRVLAVAQELQYSVSMAGRGLATSRTETICFVVSRKSDSFNDDPFYPIIMRGLESELSNHGYHLLMSTIDVAQSKSASEFRPVMERRVDGVILAGPDIPSRLIVDLQQRGIPMLLVDNDLAALSIDTVNIDNKQGARLATEHLIQHGHRTIVSLLGPDSWHSSLMRGQGYREAMSAANLTPHVFHADATTAQTGGLAMRQALEAVPNLTAVFAANDAMAVGAIRELLQQQRRVPDDVAVIGFDDVAMSELYEPSLTTIRVFKREIGRQAARQMLDMLSEHSNAERAPMQILLSTELVIRRSCGCQTTTEH